MALGSFISFLLLNTAKISLILLKLNLTPLLGATSTDSVNELKVGVAHLPPIVILQRDPDTNVVLNVTGTYVNVYDWIAKRSRLELVLVPVNTTEIEKNGIYTASLDQMKGDVEIDIAALGYVPRADRLSSAEFSFPFIMLQYRFITPLPEYNSRVWAVIRPFQPMVWLCLGATMILVIAMLSLLLTFKRRGSGIELPLNRRVAYNFSLLLSNITNQGYSLPVNSRDPFRILAGAWFLVALILVNSYSGILKPALTVRTMKPVIDSFEDLVAGKKQEGITLALNADSYIGNAILNAQSGMLKKLGDHLRLHPDGQFWSAATKASHLAKMRYAMLEPETFTRYNMGLDFKLNNGKCRYWESQPVAFISYSAFALKKNGKFNQVINKALQNMIEIGLYGYWLKQEQDKLRYDKCKGQNILKPTTQEKTPLKLTDLFSAFIIFGLGISLACFVFVGELGIAMRRRKKNCPHHCRSVSD